MFHQVVLFYHTEKRCNNRHVNQTVGGGWRGGRTEDGWRTDVGQAQLQVVKPPTDRSLHAHHVKKRADKLIRQRNEQCGRAKGYRQMLLL